MKSTISEFFWLLLLYQKFHQIQCQWISRLIPTLNQNSGPTAILLSQNQTENLIVSSIEQPTSIKIRLNEPFFSDTASIINSIFTYQIPKVTIPDQRQCFIGSVSGSLQLFLNVPVSGGFIVNAKQLSIIVSTDLQKDQNRVPYIRILSCEMLDALVDAKLVDMGLLTEAINIKYKNEMITKAKMALHSTICDNINRMIQTQVNVKLLKFPRAISVYEILNTFNNKNNENTIIRHTRDVSMGVSTVTEITDQYYPVERKNKTDFRKMIQDRYDVLLRDESPNNNRDFLSKEIFLKKEDDSNLFSLLQMHGLHQLYVHLDIIDSTAGNDFFSIGIDGTVFIKNHSAVTYGDVKKDDRKLNFPSFIEKRALNILLSEFTPNSLLQQAHRAKILKIHVTQNTPIFGSLLRTTCSLDEVCLTDSVPEAGERYPNSQFEVLIDTTRPPKLTINESVIKIHMIGVATFILASTRQTVGKIPFIGYINIWIKSTLNNTNVSITLSELEILEDLDFFELSSGHLNGFRDAIKGAFNNMVIAMIDNVDVTMLKEKFKKYGLSQITVKLLNFAILFQADIDPYKLIIDDDIDKIILPST